MSEDEDDYLSDKFLVIEGSTSEAQSKTYSNLRKEAHKQAQIKNEQNRTKSKRQRELESREEGLCMSLFERAKEEEVAGISSGNKALSIMVKMGFKPGQSLGNTKESVVDPVDHATPRIGTDDGAFEGERNDEGQELKDRPGHIVEPIPIVKWAGNKGIGVTKRPRSPSAAERTAKMAKMAQESSRLDYRDRASQEYTERRAEGKIEHAQRTCATLDEKAGKRFNVLWLNPNQPETLPGELLEAFLHNDSVHALLQRQGESIQRYLRRQMQADALKPLDELEEENSSKPTVELKSLSEEDIKEAAQFLRLQAQDRLVLVTSYMRDKYHYCFWCGVEYESEDEMNSQCPGYLEEDHN